MLAIVQAFVHSVEFLAHWMRGTPNLKTTIAVSLGSTILSTVFNLYAMRHGDMVIGAEGQSFRSDLRRVPRLIAAFVLSQWLAFTCSARGRTMSLKSVDRVNSCD